MRYINREKVEWIKKRGYTAQIFLDFKEEGNNSRFVVIKMMPQSEIKPHYHTKIKEILYVTKGRGKIIVDGVERRYGPEDIILVEPKEIHAMKNDTDEIFEWLEFKMHDPPQNDLFFSEDEQKSK